MMVSLNLPYFFILKISTLFSLSKILSFKFSKEDVFEITILETSKVLKSIFNMLGTILNFNSLL